VVGDLGRFLLQLQADGVWTLASIRADAVPQLKQHPTLRQVFGSNEGQYYLERMLGRRLDDVISRPAAAAASRSEGPVRQRLDQLLREEAYRDRENALPLLQFTCLSCTRIARAGSSPTRPTTSSRHGGQHRDERRNDAERCRVEAGGAADFSQSRRRR